jgi:parallel beta-helix repeat protein
MKKLFLLVLVLFMVSFVSAQTYYVSPSGNNGNDGLSEQTAWQTIAYANDQHNGGDTVYIMPGEYREKIDPKQGIDQNNPTVYSGYGAREQVKILGSEEINPTSWVQCTSGDPNCAGIPSQNLQYIYYADFTHDETRWEKFNQPNYPYSDRCISGGAVCKAYTTDCFEDRQNWFLNANLLLKSYGPGLIVPYIHAYSSGPHNITEPGKFLYDPANSLVYVWTFNSDNPTNHQIECSKRRITGSDAEDDIYLNSFTTIQNLTIMQSLDNGIIINGPSNHFNILNNEIMFTSGSGTYANNPSAIYKGGSTTGPLQPEINIIGNKIHDIGSDRGPAIVSRASQHSGAAITLYVIRDSKIEDNLIYHAAESIYIKSRGFHNITIKNNIIHDFVGTGIEFGFQRAGVITSGIIANNLIYNSDGSSCIATTRGNKQVLIYSNTVWNCFNHEVSIEVAGESANLGEDFTIKNNLISKSRSNIDNEGSFIALWWDSEDTTVSDHNLFYDKLDAFGLTDSDSRYTSGGTPTTWYNTFDEWKSGTGKDLHSIEADPLFISTDPSDPGFLRPAEGSPAIDNGEFIPGYHCALADDNGGAGLTGCKHWYGSAPDIGYFEFTGPSPPICEANNNCYYVSNTDPACSDSGPGSFNQPFCTVNRGAIVATAGDTVYIREGTYNENVGSDCTSVYTGNDCILFPRNDGTFGNPITFTKYPGDAMPVIQGAPGTYAVLLNSRSHITIDSLEIIGSHNRGVVFGEGHYLTIKNNHIHDNSPEGGGNNNGGIVILHNHPNQATNILIENNEIHDNKGPAGHADANSGIHVYCCTDCTIRNNHVYNEFAGIYLKGSATHPTMCLVNVEVSNNTVYDVDDGIKTSAVADVYGTEIYRNVVYNIGNAGRGIAMYNAPFDITVQNINYYNNVVDGNGGGRCLVVTTGSDINVYNNILLDCNDGTCGTSGWGARELSGDANLVSNFNENNNIIYDPQNNVNFCWYGSLWTLSEWRANTGNGANSISADPLFVDRLNHDYRLTQNSPAIDAGVDVGLPYSGNAPDIGAFEYGGAPPPPQTCAQQGGNVCNPGDTCSGSWLSASDTNYCCSGSCVPEQPQPGITVDSTYPGYDIFYINDDSTSSGSWASGDSSVDPHWVAFNFSTPQEVGNVTVYWAWNGYWMTPQHLDVHVWDGNSYVDVASFDRVSDVPSTSISFTPVTTISFRIWQPADMSNPQYSRVLWLTEIDYGSEGSGCVSTNALLSGIGDWFNGNINISSLVDFIKQWKANSC